MVHMPWPNPHIKKRKKEKMKKKIEEENLQLVSLLYSSLYHVGNLRMQFASIKPIATIFQPFRLIAESS